jgi:uracil-DNA glycosylase
MPEPTDSTDPPRDCPACARLVTFREKSRAAEPDWHNAPVVSFGTPDARLLIVGLAPGLRGANRTGRPFTGDFAGELLYGSLIEHGFARGSYRADPADGLALVDCRITNAVRCVPPENKPTPAEIGNCRGFLAATIANMQRLAAILVLGRIAHESTLVALGCKRSSFPFAHAGRYPLKPGLILFASYHCSRYNTQTGRLTPAMFHAVLADIRSSLDARRSG